MPGPRLLAALVLLSVPLTGCIGQADGIERELEVVDGDVDPDQARDEDEFWMVWIRGSELDVRDPQFVCSRIPPDYRIDAANWTLVYDNRSYSFTPGEVDVLLAFDHEDHSSGCAAAEHLVANPGLGYTETTGAYGELTVTVEADGTLVVDGHRVPLGSMLEASYEGDPPGPQRVRVDGSFRVENLGAWPHQHLERGDP
ncbi:hypothetical protein BRD56_03235 [Thermoplasmatales archaeon SW_10_69_26]|nr:MAG: hypothetical protein BRD56_03235 [Thermoplasmatales archaeon SW_10_69_26]